LAALCSSTSCQTWASIIHIIDSAVTPLGGMIRTS
jgi:hypothetical protein